TGIIASFIVYTIYPLILNLTPAVPMGNILAIGIDETPDTIDPLDSWNYYHLIPYPFFPPVNNPTNTPDSISNYILNQVVETLIAYDLSDPSFPLKGRLAESWDFQNTKFGTNITFQLRENVFFHDGSEFNGDCVIHTFERINYFSNWTGNLPYTEKKALTQPIYKFSDGTPIFNHSLSFVSPTDNLEVTLVLNAPFGPAEGLLAYTASAIIHPNSTLVDKMLNPYEDLLIGTGPFKILCFAPELSIRLTRWDRYWSTGAFWDEIRYIYYDNSQQARNTLISGDIDYLMNPLDSDIVSYIADPEISVVGDGNLNYSNGSIYWYIGINSMVINRTWRKAICHAFNYSYLIHNIKEDKVVRAASLVHPHFPEHNSSIQACTYNISYARLLMQKMGYGVGWEVGSMNGEKFIPGADESQWTEAEFIPNLGNFSVNQWNFAHRQGSHFMELLIQRFAEDMDLLGIDVVPMVLTWDQWFPPYYYHPERIHFHYSGWGSDYVEAFYTIDPLFNPESDHNLGLIDDAEINNLLDQVKGESDTSQRYQNYKKLQYIIHKKNYYHMPLMYDKRYYVHRATLKGFLYNPMKISYWYPTYRG
ncbi:MAG: ABC transporter substrate-binding protein, partial [Candidatus Thorarchaeota archaeon]